MRENIKNSILLFVFWLIMLSTIQIQAQTHLSDDEFDSLRKLQLKMPDDTSRLEILEKICRKSSNLDTIEKYALIQLNLAKYVNNKSYIGSSTDLVGWCKLQKYKYFEAAKYYRLSMEIFKSIGDKKNYANSMAGLGEVMFKTRNFEKGLLLELEALKIYESQNDTTMITSIYRRLGRSCIEHKLNKDAKEYLYKALEIDLKTNNLRNIGRDYYFLGQSYNDKIHNRTIEQIKIPNEYFKKTVICSMETEDNMYLIFASFVLTLQYNELAAKTNNWKYQDTANYYTKICKQTIEDIGFEEYKIHLAVLRAEQMILSGFSSEALKILKEYEKNPKLIGTQFQMLYRAYELYYFYNKDYKGILELIDKEEHITRYLYIRELGVKLEIMSSLTDYEIYLTQLEKQEKNRNLILSEKMKQHKLLKEIFTCIGGLIGVVIIAMLISVNHNNKHNKILTAQSAKIIETNKELSTLNAEVKKQAEELIAQTKQIKKQRNKLASINFRIVLNMDLAEKMQRSISIPTDKLKKMFGNLFVMWRPLDAVSGDFYWASQIGDLKMIAVADCTGHGVPGACLSVLGIAMLNSIIARVNPETITAAEILNTLRTRISESLTRGETEDGDMHDGMDIALCIINRKTRRVSYSGAYRPVWVLNHGEITEWKPDRMPIAVDTDHNDDFTNHEFQIKPDDRIYLFTDGLTDQFGMKSPGKLSKFMGKRLRMLLQEICDDEAETQKIKIEKTMESWADKQQQTDDMLIIGLLDL